MTLQKIESFLAKLVVFGGFYPIMASATGNDFFRGVSKNVTHTI
jgi:hypothetical protein